MRVPSQEFANQKRIDEKSEQRNFKSKSEQTHTHTNTGRRWNNHEFAVKQIASTKKSIENAQCNYGIIQLLHFALARTYNRQTHVMLLSQCGPSSKLAVVCCLKVISGCSVFDPPHTIDGAIFTVCGACICVCFCSHCRRCCSPCNRPTIRISSLR